MKRYFFALAVAALVLYLHVIGMEYFLYFYYWWYDLLLHFLGGIVLALLFSFFTKNWKYILLGVVLAATAWEIFEYVLHIFGVNKEGYALDTLIDYVMACVGTLLVVWRS